MLVCGEVKSPKRQGSQNGKERERIRQSLPTKNPESSPPVSNMISRCATVLRHRVSYETQLAVLLFKV